MSQLVEQPMGGAPPPMGGAGGLGGGLGGPGGGLGGGLGGPPPMGGGMPPMGGGGGMGGPPGLGGPPGMGGGDQGAQAVPIKFISAMDMWELLKHAAEKMEASEMYKKEPENRYQKTSLQS